MVSRALFIGAAFGFYTPAMAATAQSNTPEKITSSLARIELKGPPPKITLQNIDPRHRLDSFNVKNISTQFDFKLQGSAHCQSKNIETNGHRSGTYLEKVEFGSGPQDDQYWSETVFENQDTGIQSFKGSHALSIPQSIFQKTIHNIEARALFLEKIRTLNSSEKRWHYLTANQILQATIPVRIEVICRNYKLDKVSGKIDLQSRFSIIGTQALSVQIFYKADRKLTRRLAPILNGKMATKIVKQAAPDFFKVQDAIILTGPKNMRGACPLTARFETEIRGTGNGHVQLQVVEAGKIVYKSGDLKFSNGKNLHTFEIASGTPEKGKTYSQYPHELKLQVFTKSHQARRFTTFPKKFNTAFYWQHSCISVADK
ncbi:MAG: hypothetical protein V7740_00325 [Pseudomonas marincola]